MGMSYVPTTDPERFFAYFGVTLPWVLEPGDARAGSDAPFIRRANRDSTLAREACLGVFGLESQLDREDDPPRVRGAHSFSRRCVVAADAVYELRREGSDVVAWRIERSDDRPLGIAGIWDTWTAPSGLEIVTFAMLTVKSRHFGAFQPAATSDDTPRVVAILEDDAYDAWLEAPLLTQSAVLSRNPDAPLVATPLRDRPLP